MRKGDIIMRPRRTMDIGSPVTSGDTGQRHPDQRSSSSRHQEAAARQEAARQEAALINQLNLDYHSNNRKPEAIRRFGERFLQITASSVSDIEIFPRITPAQCRPIQEYISQRNIAGQIKALAIMHAEIKKIEAQNLPSTNEAGSSRISDNTSIQNKVDTLIRSMGSMKRYAEYNSAQWLFLDNTQDHLRNVLGTDRTKREFSVQALQQVCLGYKESHTYNQGNADFQRYIENRLIPRIDEIINT
jgi:hypothetical protein